MSLRDGPFGDFRLQLIWVALAAAALAILIAAVVFFGRGGRADDVVRPDRAVATPPLGAAGAVTAAPVRWTGDVLGYGRDYLFAASQNHQLRADLAATQSLKDDVLRLQAENDRLRALLGVRTNPPIPTQAARTVLDARGPFANTRIADAGADKGVIEGNPVLSEHGLVGRVIGVAAHASRIMLLTDLESRVPVMTPRTNGRALLTGDGGPSPKLDYLRTHDAPRVGDRVLTSGDGGVLPRGLPVGSVVHGWDGSWRVSLDSDAAPIDYVRILLFHDFSQVSAASALAPSVLPPTVTGVQAPASSQPPSAIAAPRNAVTAPPRQAAP